MQLFQLSPNTTLFPPVEKALADPNGLLAFGGDLSPDRLLAAAYRHVIFPWYSPGDPILWWSPDPRAVLHPQALHISRSLRKFMRKQLFHITLNYAFSSVIHACANARQEGTWISPAMIAAYCKLHELGYAHSIEVWYEDELVGGLYGIAQGTLFCGESMFSTRDNASKCALVALVTHFMRYMEGNWYSTRIRPLGRDRGAALDVSDGATRITGYAHRPILLAATSACADRRMIKHALAPLLSDSCC